MKVINITCPNCGSGLKGDTTSKEYTCEYCGAKLLIDNDAIHLICDNAQETGYQFERGRQRALKEVSSTTKFYHQTSTQKPKKKKPVLLWTLGWIFIFPLPLTILTLRKKNWKPFIKFCIITVAWIVFLSLIWNTSTQQPKLSSYHATDATIVSQSNNNTTSKHEQEITSEQTFYDGDAVVNHFISDYNSRNTIPITSIKRGNIRQKAYAYIGNVYIMMLNSYDALAGNFNMSVFGGNNIESTNRMFDVFKSVATVLDPNLTEKQIDESISSWRSGDVLVEKYEMGKLTITYVPFKQLSTGSTSSRIDVASSEYGKPY